MKINFRIQSVNFVNFRIQSINMLAIPMPSHCVRFEPGATIFLQALCLGLPELARNIEPI